MPADRIRGKLVLVGTSAIGLVDVKTTPLDAVCPASKCMPRYGKHTQQRLTVGAELGRRWRDIAAAS